jgi:hypothetical protein
MTEHEFWALLDEICEPRCAIPITEAQYLAFMIRRDHPEIVTKARKARLWRQYAVGPNDYLSDAVPKPPPRTATWITNARAVGRRRQHRPTGKKRSGRPRVEDFGLGGAVHALMTQSGLSRQRAIAEIARWLMRFPAGPTLTFASARNRIYQALAIERSR